MTMHLPDNYIPFWHFFQRIERELSYSRSIDKYKQFLGLLHSTHLEYDTEGRSLYAACRFLYLQNHRDETRFRIIFDESWKKEEEIFRDYFTKNIQLPEHKLPEAIPEPLEKDRDNPKADPGSDTRKEPAQSRQDTAKETKREKTYFISPPDISRIQIDPDEVKKTVRVFNLQDEYLPVSRREMAKAWRYFRFYEKGRLTDEVDILQTVKKIARDTLFTEPVYQSGRRNKKNTIVIFADRTGSWCLFTN